jgi:hypothetical protein
MNTIKNILTEEQLKALQAIKDSLPNEPIKDQQIK